MIHGIIWILYINEIFNNIFLLIIKNIHCYLLSQNKENKKKVMTNWQKKIFTFPNLWNIIFLIWFRELRMVLMRSIRRNSHQNH